MDAGHDPQYGIFSINPFNQHEPAIVDTLCELAGIVDENIKEAIHNNFKRFHENDSQRSKSGKFITDTFFKQMQQAVAACKEAHKGERGYELYLTLCMRVGEISFVNMMGDIQLAGGTTNIAAHQPTK
jgi:hypothetical protein